MTYSHSHVTSTMSNMRYLQFFVMISDMDLNNSVKGFVLVSHNLYLKLLISIFLSQVDMGLY